ncbi:MAG: FliG C-terminal domain-containing protein, partial [Bacteroidales bacterium]|nr:FliG C-terminal domain-containing protein [Bacteroidales bacterium]
TKWFSDGDVHKYFNHYPSPYEAYINYMNVLADFTIRVNEKSPSTKVMMDELLEKGAKLGKEIGKTAADQLQKTAKSIEERFRKSEKQIKPAFDDLVELSDAKIKKLIKDLEAEDLVIALKDAKEELVEKVLPNLSKSARKSFDEAKEKAGRTTKTQVNKMRSAIEEKMRELF